MNAMLIKSKRTPCYFSRCPIAHELNSEIEPMMMSQPPRRRKVQPKVTLTLRSRPQQPRNAVTQPFMRDNYTFQNRRVTTVVPSKRTISSNKSHHRHHWVTAPGRATELTRATIKSKEAKNPLCLVCDPDWEDLEPVKTGLDDRNEDTLSYLTKKFLATTQEFKEKNNKHKKSSKNERQKLRVLKDLWEMESGGKPEEKLQKWADLLRSDNEDQKVITAPMKPGYNLKKKEKRKKRSTNDKENVDKNLTESLSKKEVVKEPIEHHKVQKESKSNDSTDVSITLESKKSSKESKDKKNRKKLMSENDYFVEVIINELKNENRELKWALASRDEQLNKAAEKVKEMVAENGRLARKLERALEKASAHATSYDAEVGAREEKYEARIAALTAQLGELERAAAARACARGDATAEMGVVVSELRRQLDEKERDNENLMAYIESLKQSYASVFGDQE